uniref:CUB domain-containing protein n=1 Tax=Macrostomum lignano TaxID=282301 RepID=A0A1I8G3K0_9PLAT
MFLLGIGLLCLTLSVPRAAPARQESEVTSPAATTAPAAASGYSSIQVESSTNAPAPNESRLTASTIPAPETTTSSDNSAWKESTTTAPAAASIQFESMLNDASTTTAPATPPAHKSTLRDSTKIVPATASTRVQSNSTTPTKSATDNTESADESSWTKSTAAAPDAASARLESDFTASATTAPVAESAHESTSTAAPVSSSFTIAKPHRGESLSSPTAEATGRCGLLIRSNLYRCSDRPNWWLSKADLNELKLRLLAGQSESICCRDWRNQAIYSNLNQHRDSAAGSRMRINCPLALATSQSSLDNALTTVVTGSELHCYNLCNTTLALGDGGRTHYNLFLPIQYAPVKCQWRLKGVSKVVISKSQMQAWDQLRPFLCLSDGTRLGACGSERASGQVYPLTSSATEVLQCRSGDCLLWYDWRSAIASQRRFDFRSLKVELFGWAAPTSGPEAPALPQQRRPRPASLTTAATPTAAGSRPAGPPSQPPLPRSSEKFPLEFRVTRGVMAGVTAAAVALICAAACIWGCRSWHYR